MRTLRAKRFDIVQHFYFVSGEDANYAGLAKEYRGYLEASGALAQAGDTGKFGIQVDFLGADRENGLIGGGGGGGGTVPVTMTTAGQAGDMLTELTESGVSSIASVFLGWQKNGYTGGRPVTAYTPANNLGGSGGFSALYETADALGVAMFLEADIATMIPATAGTLRYAALKKVDSNTFSRPIFGWIYCRNAVSVPRENAGVGRKPGRKILPPQACRAYR